MGVCIMKQVIPGENEYLVSSNGRASRVNATRFVVLENTHWTSASYKSNSEKLGVCLNVPKM